MAAPQMRRVVQYPRHGDSSVLQVVEAPVPPRRRGQVLVDVRAAGCNPVDYKLRDGFGVLSKLAGPRLPGIPGGDVAGVVAEADEGSQFKPGDRVFGLIKWSVGGYVCKVVLPEADLARVPEGMSFEEAAATPLAALTAWQALDLARAKSGDRVLVHAGAGGVGTFAIQLAKARGCWVATTCSASNADFVRGLGADAVVDYTKEAFEEALKGEPLDAVLDAVVLRGYEQRSLGLIKKGGTYVNFMPGPVVGMIGKGLLKSALGLGPRYRVVLVMPNGGQLAQIADLYRQGKLKPVVAQVFPLEQAAQAQDALKQGHTRGKIVLRVREPAAS